ncbi:unnamed protein product [Calypogeia fissa]
MSISGSSSSSVSRSSSTTSLEDLDAYFPREILEEEVAQKCKSLGRNLERYVKTSSSSSSTTTSNNNPVLERKSILLEDLIDYLPSGNTAFDAALREKKSMSLDDFLGYFPSGSTLHILAVVEEKSKRLRNLNDNVPIGNTSKTAVEKTSKFLENLDDYLPSGSTTLDAEVVDKKSKAVENLEHYFPGGPKRPRPRHNCGVEFAVRSSYRTESMGDLTSLCGKEECKEGDGVKVDPNVWKLLPDDLQERVLEKLPVPSLVRFRTVCKRWNSVILSTGFHFTKKDCRRKCVPLYFHEDAPITVFNKRKNSWQQISFSFLETPLKMLSLLVSVGGLLCFKTGIAGELLICNPVKRQSRRLQVPCRILHDAISVLPLHSKVVEEYEVSKSGNMTHCLGWGHYAPHDKDGAVGIVMDREGRNYKLVVAGVTLPGGVTKERGTLVYDSLTNSWKRGADVPKHCRFWRTGKPVASNGFVYFISCSKQMWMDNWADPLFIDDWPMVGRFEDSRPWGVIRYDVANDEWLAIPLARRSSVLFQLVEYQGRILIVQRRARDQTLVYTSELTEDGKVVPFVASKMPVDLFPDIRELMIGDWCVGQGDRYYVAGVYPENSWPYSWEVGYHLPNLHVDKCLGFGVLAHNPSDNTWTQLPDLCGKYYPEALYGFEPSLADA